MGLFDKLFKNKSTYSDTDIVAVATGKMIPASEINDLVFSQEMLGQTIAFELTDGNIVSPANGTVEGLFPTGHAFGVRMKDETALLVHIGINTVEMNGKGFECLVKEGDSVHAGQTIVKVDLDAVSKAGYDSTTMLIVTEPVSEQRINYIDCAGVEKGQIINVNPE